MFGLKWLCSPYFSSGPIIHPNMTSGPQNMSSSGLNVSVGGGGNMTPLSTNMSSGGQTAVLPSHHSTASAYTSNNMLPHNNQQHHTMTQVCLWVRHSVTKLTRVPFYRESFIYRLRPLSKPWAKPYLTLKRALSIIPRRINPSSSIMPLIM